MYFLNLSKVNQSKNKDSLKNFYLKSYDKNLIIKQKMTLTQLFFYNSDYIYKKIFF